MLCIRLLLKMLVISKFHIYIKFWLGFLHLDQYILGLSRYLILVQSFLVEFYILPIDRYMYPSLNSSLGLVHIYLYYGI
jgi:hypothetical protein